MDGIKLNKFLNRIPIALVFSISKPFEFDGFKIWDGTGKYIHSSSERRASDMSGVLGTPC